MKRLLLLLVFSIFSLLASAQSFNYSYVNPCNGNVEKITIPAGSNSVAVTYYNQVKVFNEADFLNGTFDTWAKSVFNSYSKVSPCAGIGTSTVLSITQNTAMTVISIMGSLTTISDVMGSINSLGGLSSSVANGSGESKGSNKKSDKNKEATSTSSSPTQTPTSSSTSTPSSPSTTTSSGSSSSSSTTTPSSSTGTTTPSRSSTPAPSSSSTSSSTTTPGSSTAGSSSSPSSSTPTTTPSSSSSSSSTSSNSNSTPAQGKTTEGSSPSDTKTEAASDDKKTDVLSGSNNAVRSTPANGSANSKNGLKPTVVAGSDLAGFNFKDGDIAVGGKVNGNYTSVRYDQRRSHGFLFDYTTAIKGPNVTFFYAWMKPKRITLLSNTLTIGFEGKGSQYNSVAFGQMRNIGKSNKLKLVYLGSVSVGRVYEEAFIGTALIAGGMYDLTINKRVDLKLMALGVYAPYVSYYNDILLQSPYVVLPTIGTNLKVTKNFRFNINWGGAWAIKQSVLNYTITIGTRLVL